MIKTKTRINAVIFWLRKAIEATAPASQRGDPARQRGELVVKPSVVYGLEALVELARLSSREETRDNHEDFLAHIAGLVADLRNGPRVRTAETFGEDDRDALRSLLALALKSLPTAEMLDRLKEEDAMLTIANPDGFPAMTTPACVPPSHAFLASDPWRALADLVDMRRDVPVYSGDETVYSKPGIKSLFLGRVVPLQAPPGVEVYRVGFDKAMGWEYGSKTPRESLIDLAFQDTKALPLKQWEQEWNGAGGCNFWEEHWLTVRPDGQDLVVYFVDSTGGLCPHGRLPADCADCYPDGVVMYLWEKRVPFWMAGLEHLFNRCPHGNDLDQCEECCGEEVPHSYGEVADD